MPRARTHTTDGCHCGGGYREEEKNEIQVGRLVVIEETQSAHYYYDIPVQRSAAVHDERGRVIIAITVGQKRYFNSGRWEKSVRVISAVVAADRRKWVSPRIRSV